MERGDPARRSTALRSFFGAVSAGSWQQLPTKLRDGSVVAQGKVKGIGGR